MGLLRRRGGNISIRVYAVPEPQPPAPQPARDTWVTVLTARDLPLPGPLDPVVFPPPGAPA